MNKMTRPGLLMLMLACLFAYSQTDRGPLRSRIFRLRHNDSRTVQTMLERLNLGTEYNQLSPDVLIVTSDRTQDLIKATSVVTLADSESPVEIRPLLVPTEQVPAPKQEELAVRLRSLTIGTLLNAPPSGSPNPAIVDLFEGTVMGIASADVLDQIETFIDTWKTEKTAPSEPDPKDSETVEAAIEEKRPSLAEIAAELFGDEKPPSDIPAEPDAVESAAEETTDTATPDHTAAEPAEPVEPEPEPESEPQPKPEEAVDPEQQAIEDIRRQMEQMSADQDEASDEGLLAVLEMLMKTSEQAQQPTAESPAQDEDQAALPADEPTPDVAEPTPADHRIVTGTQLPEDKAEQELELTITLPVEVEVEDLVELVGKQLGLNYMYDPAILRNQKVMLKVHDGTIRIKDLYSLLESVLRFRGFVMTRRDRLVTIARTQDVANVDPVLRLPNEPIQPGDVVVSSVFELDHIDADSARNMLTQMKLGADFIPIKETGTLIVTDYAFRMERIRDVLAMIDVAGAPKDFQFRQIRYMPAADLVPKVKALAGEIQGVSITVSGQPAAAQPTAQPRATTAAERARQLAEQRARQQAQARAQQQAQTATNQDAVYLEADERTNRVLMIGYAEELEIVNRLIESLDVPSHDLRTVREYVIQHVEATEVITVLNELGLARVTVSTAQPTAARPPTVRPGQQLTPQQQAALQQQQAAQARQAQTVSGAGTLDEPYISLRAATNSLLVNATEEQHKAIELVISHVDVTQKDQRTIREYEIQYVDTQMILDTLTDLGIISARSTAATDGPRAAGGTTGRATPQRQTQPDAEGAPPMALPTPEGTEREITAAEPQIAVLPATNSLLIHATPRQHAAIAMVIAHADRQRERMFAPYMVYALENQAPDELAEILNRLIQETYEEAAEGTRSEPDARIQTRSRQAAILPSGEEQRIRIVPDPKTYSLIVYANQRNQQWLGELIRELDEYRPQVLLDCTLVEITSDDDFNYAINVLNSIPDLTNTSGLTGTIQGSGESVITKGDILDKLLSPDSDRSRFIDLQANRGEFTGFYGNDKVMALLTAMERKRYGRIMANPKLLVNDNEQGTIETKSTTYVTRRTTNIQQTQSGEPIQTETVEFDPYDASIKLDITPRISKGDNLRLEIILNRSDFINFDTTSQKPPDRAESDVTTVVTVPDGYTIILGGMDKINQSKGGTKVPILGDLPLLGGLFRSTSNTSQENKLYVFVKANILRPGTDLTSEDLKNLSNQYRLEFEDREAEMQLYEDWPGIKPKPMSPERVLRHGN